MRRKRKIQSVPSAVQLCLFSEAEMSALIEQPYIIKTPINPVWELFLLPGLRGAVYRASKALLSGSREIKRTVSTISAVGRYGVSGLLFNTT